MIGTTTLIARHRTNELVQNLTRTISPTFIQPGIGPYLSTNHRYLWSKEGEENLASVLTGGNHPLSSTRQQLFLAERKGKEGKALSLPGEITRLDVSPPPPPPPYSNGKVALSRGWNASTCTPPSIHRSIDIILKSALSSSSRVASKRERRSIAWQLAEETSRSNEVYTLACGHFLLCNRFREIFEKFPFFWSVSNQILIYSLITSKKEIYIFFSFMRPLRGYVL